jgi:glycosyltransferase involved in cell wall biosynthesis
MACGIPVVQPRHGAFPEIIEKTGGGILVDSEKPEDVARGIQKLVEDPALAKTLGINGAQNVRDCFSVEQEALRAVEVYSSFMESST